MDRDHFPPVLCAAAATGFFIVRAVRRTIPRFLAKVHRGNPNFVRFLECPPVLCAAAANKVMNVTPNVTEKVYMLRDTLR